MILLKVFLCVFLWGFLLTFLCLCCTITLSVAGSFGFKCLRHQRYPVENYIGAYLPSQICLSRISSSCWISGDLRCECGAQGAELQPDSAPLLNMWKLFYLASTFRYLSFTHWILQLCSFVRLRLWVFYRVSASMWVDGLELTGGVQYLLYAHILLLALLCLAAFLQLVLSDPFVRTGWKQRCKTIKSVF